MALAIRTTVFRGLRYLFLTPKRLPTRPQSINFATPGQLSHLLSHQPANSSVEHSTMLRFSGRRFLSPYLTSKLQQFKQWPILRIIEEEQKEVDKAKSLPQLSKTPQSSPKASHCLSHLSLSFLINLDCPSTLEHFPREPKPHQKDLPLYLQRVQRVPHKASRPQGIRL